MTVVSGVSLVDQSRPCRQRGGRLTDRYDTIVADTGLLIVYPGSGQESSKCIAAIRSQILDALESGKRIVWRDFIGWVVLDLSVRPLADGTVSVAHRVVDRIRPADGSSISSLTSALSRLADLLSERPVDPEADVADPGAPPPPAAAAPRQARNAKPTAPVPRAAA